jgi:hypothetical protein
MNEAIEILSWTEFRGNPFARKIKAEMLLPEGEIIALNCLAKNEGKFNEKQLRSYRFDLSYVLAKLEREFLNPLQQETLAGLKDLLDRAAALKEDVIADG